MGCFSYKCKVCNEPVNSDSFDGEECTIYRLENGKVMQQMTGKYDSYGRVFDDANGGSVEWDEDWSRCVELHFNPDQATGFAIVHERCGIVQAPTTISEDDPNQGWGKIRD